MSRLRIGVMFGGRSAEHEVSLMSGLAIMEALRERHEVVPIGITRSGLIVPGADARRAIEGGGLEAPEGLAVRPTEVGPTLSGLDVVIPALHGPLGEDGTVQGLLELAGIAYVGSGVLGSAASMDKAVMKDLFERRSLPVAPWFLVREPDWADGPGPWRERAAGLGYPVFVKPANMGSSVGVTRVEDASGFDQAVEAAFCHDRRLVVEKGLEAREFECGVLGNDAPRASVVGEVRPRRAFYDYEAKYRENGADLLIPAPIDDRTSEAVRRLAVEAFIAVDAAGLARADFFLDRDGGVWLNEINTFPGFTPFSMYPRLWKASGLSYPDLLDQLVSLAVERHSVTERKRRGEGRNDSLKGG